MKYQIIKQPSKGTVNILKNRIGFTAEPFSEKFSAIGLVQGAIIDMIVASDIAEKADNVKAFDIKESCPQNMVLLAIFGDTAGIEDAIKEIKGKIEMNKELK
ncbi:MAG: BMC domain protein [Clostridiales Family XIII bacterium]|jgi:microcompartment protein CcmL/EutN|nr:BMC domain protein [Clostridiales Family XIII bacterium]